MFYKSKPKTIEALKLTVDTITSMYEFLNIVSRGSFLDCGHGIDPTDGMFKVTTNHGPTVVQLGDFVIKSPSGEFYPCKPEVFETNYEIAE